jgi:hypothetical protein
MGGMVAAGFTISQGSVRSPHPLSLPKQLWHMTAGSHAAHVLPRMCMYTPPPFLHPQLLPCMRHCSPPTCCRAARPAAAPCTGGILQQQVAAELIPVRGAVAVGIDAHEQLPQPLLLCYALPSRQHTCGSRGGGREQEAFGAPTAVSWAATGIVCSDAAVQSARMQ